MRRNNIMQDLKNKNKTTKPRYIILMWKLLKTSTWVKRSTGIRALGVLVMKIKQSGTLVPWYKEWISRSILHICDTTLWHNGWNTLMAAEKHCMWQIQHSQGTAQIHIQCPLFRTQHHFLPRPVIAPLSTALCIGSQFLDLSYQFFDLSLSCKRLVSKATAKKHWEDGILYICATV